jgi:hypothetical protein
VVSVAQIIPFTAVIQRYYGIVARCQAGFGLRVIDVSGQLVLVQPL